MTLRDDFEKEVMSKMTNQLDLQKEYIKKNYDYDTILDMLLTETMERWFLTQKVEHLEYKLKTLKKFNSLELELETQGLTTEDMIKIIKKYNDQWREKDD